MLERSDTSASAAPAAFLITSRKVGERASVVSVQGELDLSSAPRLKWMLLDLIEAGSSELLADLSDVTFMDSTALGVLVAVNRNEDLSAPLAIVCQPGNVRQLFEVSGMEGSFRMYSTLEDALVDAARAG